jgi:hypothetical protein
VHIGEMLGLKEIQSYIALFEPIYQSNYYYPNGFRVNLNNTKTTITITTT